MGNTLPTINLFRCHPPKECFLCSPFQTPFPRRLPHSQAGRMQLSRLQAMQVAVRLREHARAHCNLPNYGDLGVFFKLRRVRFEPWRDNYKRVNQLGWRALVLLGHGPPGSCPDFIPVDRRLAARSRLTHHIPGNYLAPYSCIRNSGCYQRSPVGVP